MTTDIARVNRQALTEFIEYADNLRAAVDAEFLAGKDEYDESDREFRKHTTALAVSTVSGDDELLASVMRKLMRQYVDYDGGSRIPNTHPWVRVDGSVNITLEELAALERAEPE